MRSGFRFDSDAELIVADIEERMHVSSSLREICLLRVEGGTPRDGGGATRAPRDGGGGLARASGTRLREGGGLDGGGRTSDAVAFAMNMVSSSETDFREEEEEERAALDADVTTPASSSSRPRNLDGDETDSGDNALGRFVKGSTVGWPPLTGQSPYHAPRAPPAPLRTRGVHTLSP
jgi:hypothetical protein